MGGVQVGVDQAHRDAFIAALGDLIYDGLNLGTVNINEHRTICIDASGHGEPHLAGQKRIWQVEVQVILFKPRLGPHLDHIAKPFSGDQRRLGPAPFDQGVGGKGRAMDDLVDVAGINTRLGQNLMHPVDDRVFRGRIGGQHFGRENLRAFFQNNVGKCAADIDAKADGSRCHFRLLLKVILAGGPKFYK